jgi:hypothetical protein
VKSKDFINYTTRKVELNGVKIEVLKKKYIMDHVQKEQSKLQISGVAKNIQGKMGVPIS